MVDENIVKDTIRKMKQSGLEDAIIVSTLQDIGLNEEQAQSFISQVSGTMPPQEPMMPEPAPMQAPRQRQQQQYSPYQMRGQQPMPFPTNAQLFPGQEQQQFRQPQIPPAFPRQTQQSQAMQEQEQTQEQQPMEWQEPPLQQAPRPAIPKKLASTPAFKQTMRPQPQFQQPLEYRQQFQQFQDQQQFQQPQDYQQQFHRPAAQELRTTMADRSNEDAIRHAQTQAMIQEQAQSLNQVQMDVQKAQKEVLKATKKIAKIAPINLPPDTKPEIKAIAKEIENIRLDLEETKAMVSATKVLMEKILELNRKMLGRLP